MNLYTDLSTLKTALGLGSTDTDQDADILRVLEAVSREIDNYCGVTARTSAGLDGFGFFPRTETRLLEAGRRSLTLFPRLLALTALKVDGDDDDSYGTALTELTDFVLEPRSGIPKDAVRFLPDGTTNHLQGSGSSLGVVEIEGQWGDHDETESVGTLGAAISDTTGTSVTMASSHSVSAGDTLLVVSSGEQMYVSAVSTNTLTVERGVNGTTAATASNAAAVSAYRYPRAVEQAALMQASRLHERRTSSYANVVGSPELGTFEVFKGLDVDIRELLARYVRFEATFA